MAIHRNEVNQSLDQSIQLSRRREEEQGKIGVRADVRTRAAQKGDQLSTDGRTDGRTDNRHVHVAYLTVY